jgi:hypothetical protein
MKRWEIISEQQGHNDYFLTKKSDHRFSNKLLVAQNRVILDKLAVAVLGFRYGALESSRKWRCVSGWLVPHVPRRKLITIFFKREQYRRYVAPGSRDHYVVSKRRTAIIHWRGATSKKNGSLKVTVAQLTKMTKKEKDMTMKHKNEYESVTAQQLLYYDPPQK